MLAQLTPHVCCKSQFWVSQANKWCDYCKCWLKDTTQAWAVHERGTGHQENVARSESRRPALHCPNKAWHLVLRSASPRSSVACIISCPVLVL
jgi:hypothetical protein